MPPRSASDISSSAMTALWLADIQNTTMITTVIAHGHVVDRDALRRTITQGFP